MVRIYIDLPRNDRHRAVITSRDAVANLLIYAMKKYGFVVQPNTPAQWGFGVIAKKLSHSTQKHNLYAVQRVIVSSSDPELSKILRRLTPDDLVEPNAVARSGLDLTHAEIYQGTPLPETEAIQVYCVSPIRVTDFAQGSQPILEINQKFVDSLNQAMSKRFARDFRLNIIPDSLYVRSKHGNISAQMAIKMNHQGKPVNLKGVLLPFILTGPATDIATAWYAGLGRSTARGFGCLELAQ